MSPPAPYPTGAEMSSRRQSFDTSVNFQVVALQSFPQIPHMAAPKPSQSTGSDDPEAKETGHAGEKLQEVLEDTSWPAAQSASVVWCVGSGFRGLKFIGVWAHASLFHAWRRWHWDRASRSMGVVDGSRRVQVQAREGNQQAIALDAPHSLWVTRLTFFC